MTTATTVMLQASAIHLAEAIVYAPEGIRSRILLEDANCRYTLMAISRGMYIAEHTSPRNATVHVIEGRGVLTLEGKDIALAPGVFIVMPAKARHAIQAQENLAFLLTLSEQPAR
ncbi:MAG: cupin domain-containing protein [Pseudanabaena sp. RU_4_16]|nr:cupin domain-containing protein [Pseudanabaena sp. RU_4_16]NKB17630.1 cupin domain-containing protein [Pseudanabaena sp. CRU_2_10]